MPEACYIGRWNYTASGYQTAGYQVEFCIVASSIVEPVPLTVSLVPLTTSDPVVEQECQPSGNWITEQDKSDFPSFTRWYRNFTNSSTDAVLLYPSTVSAYAFTVTHIPQDTSGWNHAADISNLNLQADFQLDYTLHWEGTSNTDMANLGIGLYSGDLRILNTIYRDAFYFGTADCATAVDADQSVQDRPGENYLPGYAGTATGTLARSGNVVSASWYLVDDQLQPTGGKSCYVSSTTSATVTNAVLQFSRSGYPGSTMPKMQILDYQLRVPESCE